MPKRPISPDDLLRYILVGDPQFSPDGQLVLFTRKHINEKKHYVTNLWVSDREGNRRPLTQGESGNGHGRWLPDGTGILFISGREKPLSQIFQLPIAGGEAFAVTKLPEGSLADFKISPDGQHVAVTFRETQANFTAKAKKEREESGASLPPIEIDDIWYRLDGDGYFAGQRYQIIILKLPTEPGTFATEVTHYAGAPDGNYSYNWHPNSQELIVAHTANDFPSRQTPNDQLYRLNLKGEAFRLSGLPKGEKSVPTYSPDGQWIAYAGDTDEGDPWGTRNTKAYLVKPKGGAPTDLTGAQDFDIAVATLSDAGEASYGASLIWNADSTGLFTQVGSFGESQIGYISIDGGITLLTEGRHSISLGSVDADGNVAGVIGNPTQLPELALVGPELGTGRLVAKQLSDFNQALLEEVELFAPAEHWVETADGTKVHVWSIVPDASKQQPALLNIHGGPHTQYGWTYFHEFQVFAAAGYAVVYSNPRGSKGYGEAHCAAIRGDWGNKDWIDMQAVTAWMKSQPWADASKLGVMGGSYGGYMTNWIIGQTTEFACAITDRCVSNMVSMAGNSDFPFNRDGYFKGVAWGSLEDIKELWRQSPIAYFQNVKTPTLVIHSEGDLRCNVEQGEQVFTALQQQGIPSRFVRYPVTTSHGLSRSGPPDLRLHRIGEYLGWIKRWLG
jgi:dipeptidyl aminopeptidase/acylaminoacyl peptidase